MLKKTGWFLIFCAVLGTVGELCKIDFPTVRFPFSVSRNIGILHAGTGDGALPWFGWLLTILTLLAGVWMSIHFAHGARFTPITLRRIERFKSIKRGYYSLLIIVFLAALASLDHLLVGKEPLLVSHKGEWSFPAFTRGVEKGDAFGLTGDRGQSPPNYRKLKEQFKESDEGWMILPLVPYDPTGDSITAVSTEIKVDGDKLIEGKKPFQGLAAYLYDIRVPERMHLRYTYRAGVRQGQVDGWDEDGNYIYNGKYQAGKLVEGSEKWNGEGALADFLAKQSSGPREVHFPATPPSFTKGQRHLIGTNSSGYDVLAYLFGGLQVNFKAALVYIPIVYFVGISIGLLMGFFGGTFDLLFQRVIEILSNIPFLFVVMIASTAVPEKLKETAGLWMILGILLMFGWMGMTYVMRTAALKEKSRDYIAASRVIGASTPRILFRHLLPNSLAIIVTLIPFSVSGLVLSLTSLDYLGFGLPSSYATWGQLLQDGLQNLSKPWLVSSSFFMLVCFLTLITFVGEAVREAFDPKKFSYYR
ncbi:MAG: microcin C transport system permease protein [Verrucomicrobiales bacterium]|jgi:microcin C transport system permease protein